VTIQSVPIRQPAHRSEIAAASGEQAQGISQVNTAVSEMDNSTQQAAANSESKKPKSSYAPKQAIVQPEQSPAFDQADLKEF
jgi:hypothetical protein